MWYAMSRNGTRTSQSAQAKHRATVYLSTREWEQLKEMAQRAHRRPSEQLRYLIAREAEREAAA
jgi:hypothetical protein